jgi:hypothetical protein
MRRSSAGVVHDRPRARTCLSLRSPCARAGTRGASRNGSRSPPPSAGGRRSTASPRSPAPTRPPAPLTRSSLVRACALVAATQRGLIALGRPLARVVTRRHVLQRGATCCNALRRGATQHASAPPPPGGGKANKRAAPALDWTGLDCCAGLLSVVGAAAALFSRDGAAALFAELELAVKVRREARGSVARRRARPAPIEPLTHAHANPNVGSGPKSSRSCLVSKTISIPTAIQRARSINSA